MTKYRLRITELMDEKARKTGQPITATDVARAIGVSHNTVLSYVRNEREPSFRLLTKLKDYFGCSFDDLFDYESPLEGEEKPPKHLAVGVAGY